jgi:inosine-uridine nucleoside N-ribohydrolase
MGCSFAPVTDDREFKLTPRREFNIRFDAEAARAVFRAGWSRVTCSPIDVSQHTRSTPDLFAAIARADMPLARYLNQFGPRNRPMWDEVSAATWIDESLVTQFDELFLDVDLAPDADYGNTLSWPPGQQPRLGECWVRVQKRLDDGRFYELFVALSSR